MSEQKVPVSFRRGLDARPARRILDEFEEEDPAVRYYRVPEDLFRTLRAILDERVRAIKGASDSPRKIAALKSWGEVLSSVDQLPLEPAPPDRRKSDITHRESRNESQPRSMDAG